MKQKGYMSVFFSLSVLCICALLFAMVESARMAGARCYLQMAVNSSIDSVFSQYHRELWEQYRLLFVEYQSEAEANADFKRFLSPYFEADSWYPMADRETVVEQMIAATDSGGDYLEKEILDYMKFGIWNMEFQPDQMESLYRDGMEAEAVHEIAESYRTGTRTAWKLEQAIEQIDGALKEMNKLLNEAHSYLRNYDGHGFSSCAVQLVHQLKRMPALVNTYIKRADQLSGALAASRERLNSKSNKLSDAVRRSLEQEIAEYESFIAIDGRRRLEIESLTSWSEVQTEHVKAALREAEEVMEILSDGEAEEEEADPEELWGRVSATLNRFQSRSLDVIHGIQDKEKQNWLEQAESLFRLDILSLVLPERAEVSKGVLNMNDLPSENHMSGSDETGAGINKLVNRLQVTMYCGQFFSDFRKSCTADKHKEHPMQYELEYLFAGESIDERNLEQTVRQLLLIREGFNLIHIFSSSEKREAAKALAMMIVGGTGLLPLVMITTFFIISVWALGEAVMDLRLLLDGKKVPLQKAAADWQLSLDQLLSAGREGGLPQTETPGRGLVYEAYLKFILFFSDRQKLYYRMMDIIEINLRRKQNTFRMNHAVYRLDIRQTVINKHVFLAPALFQPYGETPGLNYESQAVTQKAY